MCLRYMEIYLFLPGILYHYSHLYEEFLDLWKNKNVILSLFLFNRV